MEKYILNKYIVVIFVLFFSEYFFCQQATMVYGLTLKPSTNKKDTISSKFYYLDILNQESVFRSEFRRHSDSIIHYRGRYGFGYNTNFNDQIYIKKDLKNKKIQKYVVTPFSTDKFYIKISEPITWKVYSDAKKIGDFNCQKAETDYGGRHWTAWFTQDIQIPEGPYVFNGLPGLIVQISDEKGDYIFKLAQIRKLNDNSIFATPGGGNEINWEEFKKIQQNYYNDPFSYARLKNIGISQDDGQGGAKKADLREWTLKTREYIKKFDNVIELNQKVDYK
ncbi:GLPGLI family protein [Elizabethkingia meningoseptica]|uniref:GLPGLI family protein n=1 Tax=Elizabethkingia meningoseptica TaxID=238 RepID=UPI0023B0B167|nr:GLPGLI family protein [Elizabethkingia meningoseptica]MDE5437921.1 GLPGLI family protein [Elizabethkingia meningoseptica]MDE5507046.1 GLPGLI family protein [Elizabethkingia meningoseptica]MDE5515671.1 GLPGLI family protein [Elizabethkingia meningoseptica]MDE5525941.1 GLPGLI family protein [Elizabethkingia meningoseptica]MDE5529938.1 GLPGLI family protein [Elizabethkingia meningoseptica]